jgi:hypothetical protein
VTHVRQELRFGTPFAAGAALKSWKGLRFQVRLHITLELAWNEEHQGKNDIKGNREPCIDEGEQYRNGVKNWVDHASYHSQFEQVSVDSFLDEFANVECVIAHQAETHSSESRHCAVPHHSDSFARKISHQSCGTTRFAATLKVDGLRLLINFERIRLTKHAADIALARDELAASPGACCLRASSLQFSLALGHLRFWEIADGESGQRIVRIRFVGVNGKHCQVFAYHPSISSTAILSPLSVKL